MIQEEMKTILNRMAQAIYDKKGVNILALDVQNCSNVTDYVVIAEGLADRHVIALAESVTSALSELGWKYTFQQGMDTGDWVVLDFSQLIVHIFMPGIRDKYHLEALWPTSEIVDLTIDVFTKEYALLG